MDSHTQNAGFVKASQEFTETLGALQTRGRRLTLTSGLAWCLGTAILIFTALIFALGWWGGLGVRVAGWSLLIAVVAFVIAVALWRPWRRIQAADGMARILGIAFPDLASSMRSASEFSRLPSPAAFSEDLLAAALQDARKHLLGISPAAVFPLRMLALPMLFLAVSMMAFASMVWVRPAVASTGWRLLFSEPQVPGLMGRVDEVSPVVSDMVVTLRYPHYLQREARVLTGVSGGVRAPAGTEIALQARSLLPDAVDGFVLLSTGARFALNVAPDGSVSGRFAFMEGDWFSVSLSSRTKEVHGPRTPGSLEAVQHPFIKLLSPVGRVEMEMNGEILLQYEAIDDHSLSRIDLIVRGAEQNESRRTINAFHTAAEESVSGKYLWSLGAIATGENAQVELVLQAFDNDTVHGPKSGSSEPLLVRVRTPLSQRADLVRRQGELLDKMVDLLAKRMRHRDAAMQELEHVNLRNSTEDVLSGIAKLIVDMEDNAGISPLMRELWIRVRQDLSNQLIHESRLMRNAAKNKQRLISVNRVFVRLIETAIVRVDDMILEQQFKSLGARGEWREKERNHLETLVRQYDDNRSERVRGALLDTIARMEAQLVQLREKLEEIRGQVSYHHVQPSLSGGQDLHAALQHLRELLAAGDVASAVHLAERIKRDVAALMASLESGRMAFRTERFGEEEKFMDNLMTRTQAIEATQVQVRRDTLALERRYKEQLISLMQKKIDDWVVRQLARVSQMKKISAAMLADAQWKKEDSKALSRMLGDLEFSIGQGDLEQARQSAASLDEWLQSAGKTSSDSLEKIVKLNAELRADIDASFPRPGQIFTAADKRAAKIRAAEQRHLLARTRKLIKWLREQEGDTRYISRRASQTLDAVVEDMKTGVSSLENKELQRALNAQSQVIEALANLRKELRTGQEIPLVDTHPLPRESEVIIPLPADYQVPKKFRKEIIEAMKSKMPDTYREAIRKYYEALVH